LQRGTTQTAQVLPQAFRLIELRSLPFPFNPSPASSVLPLLTALELIREVFFSINLIRMVRAVQNTRKQKLREYLWKSVHACARKQAAPLEAAAIDSFIAEAIERL
jgi:hypothetical protein